VPLLDIFLIVLCKDELARIQAGFECPKILHFEPGKSLKNL
jgi:hypothetical protein